MAVLNNVNGFLVFSHFKKQNSTFFKQNSTFCDLLSKNSLPLAAPRSSRSSRRKKRKFDVYASLPYDVKEARASCKDAFETWKQVDFYAESNEHDAYKAKRKYYRLSMRSFLNQLESDRVTKLCSAADSDE